MPNWVKNNIEFPTSDACRAARELMQTSTCNFDFNQLEPMPEALEIEDGSRTNEALAYYCDVNDLDINLDCTCILGPIDGCLERAKDRIEAGAITAEEYLEFGEKIYHNIEAYGHPTWYGWCCEHWGTKWLPYEVAWSNYSVSFGTAWSGVHDIVKALSDKLGCELYYEWADEDFGYNCGELVVKPDENLPKNLSTTPLDDFKTAARNWDEEQMYYRFDAEKNEIVYGDWDDPAYEEETRHFRALPVIDTSSELLRAWRTSVMQQKG